MLVVVTSVIMLFLYQLDGDSTVTLINKEIAEYSTLYDWSNG